MDTVNTNRQTGPRTPIEWEAHEYIHTEKDHEWYWALGLIAVAGAVAALLFSNVLFAILILLSSFVLAIFASRKPDLVRFALTQRGVRINDTLYPFQSLTSFGIDENHHITPKLIIVTKKHLSPEIYIPLENVDVNEVHHFMSNFLPEEDHVEPLRHHIMEYLGF